VLLGLRDAFNPHHMSRAIDGAGGRSGHQSDQKKGEVDSHGD
jgi:hypothetical protein